jgi:hypothetical protein
VEGGVQPRLRDYLRREINAETGWPLWSVDASMYPPPNRWRWVVVFVLRCYRLALPKLVSGFNVVATLAGISVVTIVGVIKDFTAGDFAIVGVGVLLILLTLGAYLLWRDTEGDKWILGTYLTQLQQAEAVRTDYAALRQAIGHFLAAGIDWQSLDESQMDQSEIDQAHESMEVWVNSLRQFVADAFDPGEHAYALVAIPLDSPLDEQIDAGVAYLTELLHSRLVTLTIRDGFDAQPWIEAWMQDADETDEAESADGQPSN